MFDSAAIWSGDWCFLLLLTLNVPYYLEELAEPKVISNSIHNISIYNVKLYVEIVM